MTNVVKLPLILFRALSGTQSSNADIVKTTSVDLEDTFNGNSVTSHLLGNPDTPWISTSASFLIALRYSRGKMAETPNSTKFSNGNKLNNFKRRHIVVIYTTGIEDIIANPATMKDVGDTVRNFSISQQEYLIHKKLPKENMVELSFLACDILEILYLNGREDLAERFLTNYLSKGHYFFKGTTWDALSFAEQMLFKSWYCSQVSLYSFTRKLYAESIYLDSQHYYNDICPHFLKLNIALWQQNILKTCLEEIAPNENINVPLAISSEYLLHTTYDGVVCNNNKTRDFLDKDTVAQFTKNTPLKATKLRRDITNLPVYKTCRDLAFEPKRTPKHGVTLRLPREINPSVTFEKYMLKGEDGSIYWVVGETKSIPYASGYKDANKLIVMHEIYGPTYDYKSLENTFALTEMSGAPLDLEKVARDSTLPKPSIYYPGEDGMKNSIIKGY